MVAVKRDGLDNRLAFTSALSSAAATLAESSGGALSQAALVDSNPAMARRTAKTLVKRALRPVAKLTFRVAKPFARPILFRMRRYLIEGARNDLFNEITAVHNRQLAVAHEANVERARQYDQLLAAARESASVTQLHNKTQARELTRMISDVTRDLTAEIAATRGEIGVLAEELRPATLAAASPLDSIARRLDRLELGAARNEILGTAAARRFAVNTGEGEVLLRTNIGYVVCAANDHALVSGLIEAGELEPGTRALLEKLLTPGDVYIDVGANIGMHAIAAGKSVTITGKVFAFEPFPATARYLTKNLWLNGLADVGQVQVLALSDHAGDEEFFLGPTSGHHSLFELGGNASPDPRSVSVRVARLDDALPPGVSPTVIKIDVEGAELAVLRGALATIEAAGDLALIVEFGPSHLARVGIDANDWFVAFTGLGFSAWAIDEVTGGITPASAKAQAGVASTNILFARKNGLMHKRAQS